jgi:hypothetical protein
MKETRHPERSERSELFQEAMKKDVILSEAKDLFCPYKR